MNNYLVRQIDKRLNTQVVNYSDSRTIEDIVDASVKLVSFLDLCGHHKYLKTTLLGLTG